MSVPGHGRLLLASARGEQAEDDEGDQAEDQDIHELDALEAIAHEHRGQQATGGQAGQRAEPARSTACGSGLLTSGLLGGGIVALLRRCLASLVAGCRAEALAAAEALGVGIDAEGQTDTQRHENAKHTLH